MSAQPLPQSVEECLGALVTRARSGVAAASEVAGDWDALFTRLRPILLSRVHCFADRESVSAVLGEVWLKGKERLCQCRAVGSDDQIGRAYLVYLVQVYRTTYLNYLTREVRKGADKMLPLALANAIPVTTEAGPFEVVLGREEQVWLQRVLASLSAEDRELIQLRFTEGLTPNAIGPRLGCDPKTIRCRLQKILQRLRGSR